MSSDLDEAYKYCPQCHVETKKTVVTYPNMGYSRLTCPVGRLRKGLLRPHMNVQSVDGATGLYRKRRNRNGY